MFKTGWVYIIWYVEERTEQKDKKSKNNKKIFLIYFQIKK